MLANCPTLANCTTEDVLLYQIHDPVIVTQARAAHRAKLAQRSAQVREKSFRCTLQTFPHEPRTTLLLTRHSGWFSDLIAGLIVPYLVHITSDMSCLLYLFISGI